MVVELDETDTPLHQAPGQEAVVGERLLTRPGPVHAVDVLRFIADVHQFGDAGLHPVGQFVGGDTAQDLRVAHRPVLPLIELLQGVEGAAARLAGHPTWVGQIWNRVTLGPELHALVDRGQEGGPPTRVAGKDLNRTRLQDDEAGQVAVLAAQTVGQPRSHAGPSDQVMARVHEQLCRCVIELLGVDGLDDGDVVHDLCEVRQQLREFGPGLTVSIIGIGRGQIQKHLGHAGPGREAAGIRHPGERMGIRRAWSGVGEMLQLVPIQGSQILEIRIGGPAAQTETKSVGDPFGDSRSRL